MASVRPCDPVRSALGTTAWEHGAGRPARVSVGRALPFCCLFWALGKIGES